VKHQVHTSDLLTRLTEEVPKSAVDPGMEIGRRHGKFARRSAAPAVAEGLNELPDLKHALLSELLRLGAVGL
jgi:hypothetical protein